MYIYMYIYIIIYICVYEYSWVMGYFMAMRAHSWDPVDFHGMEKIHFWSWKDGFFQHEMPGFITESADHPGVFDFHRIHHRFPTVFLFARDFWGKSTILEFRRNLWILGAKDHVDHCGWSLVGYVGEYPPFLWLKYPMFVGCPPHL